MEKEEKRMTQQLSPKLSAEQYTRARRYLLEEARPLEAAIFRYRFEEGDADDVYAKLAAYQNPDGGFGNALEPDVRAAASSVLATTTALQKLRMLHAPAQHPLVAGAMAWLLSAYDPALQSWPLVPAAVEDAPHAPWWNQEGLADRFGRFRINPRAEVLGYLFEFGEEADPGALALRDELAPQTISELLAHTATLSNDEFLCCLRLVESPGLHERDAVELQRWLLRMAEGAVAVDPAAWSGYVLQPLQVAPTRAAPLGIPLAHILPANLDYVIQSQSADGSWSPTWTWFGAYPEDWPQAEREWRGVLTLERLEWLHAYDRMG
jgi:hypothetical protein